MKNNRNFLNCVTLDQEDRKMLKTSNFVIQIYLGCLFDLHRDICYFSPGLYFIGILLFENNEEQ